MSALIFVALAGAWAVYLVPKALKQHEDADAARSVESFSDRLRVLNPRSSSWSSPSSAEVEEVAQQPSADAEEESVLEPVRLTPVQLRLRRAAARRAASRRRRVLLSLIAVLVVVAGVALVGRIPTYWIAAPVAVIVAWLVACRLMVKKETAARTRVVKKRRTTLADQAIAEEESTTDEVEDAHGADGSDADAAETAAETGSDGTEEIPAVGRASASTWEPVPMTLPTYVAKAPASRTVRTIDLDSTGVWSSGRNAGDSEIAREADTARRDQRDVSEESEKRRASGS